MKNSPQIKQAEMDVQYSSAELYRAVDHLADAIVTTVDETQARIQAKVEQIRHPMERIQRFVRDNRHVYDCQARFMLENPLASLALVTVAGAIVGMFLRSKVRVRR